MAPRPLRPKDERAALITEEKPQEPQGSKRRAVSSACIPCRKRKSKCDGALPSCSTCTAVYRTECIYDADSDHRRKGALKRDIHSLQERYDALEVVVTSLRGLPENEAIALVHSIRADANLDALAASLRMNVNLPQRFSHQTLHPELEHLSPTPSSSRSANATSSLSRDSPTDEAQLHSGPVTPGDTSSFWFAVPHDPEFVQHLLNLYFCWIHPFHQFFSRDSFLNDMNRGRTEYCSGILLNAILSLACEYSDRPSARMVSVDPTTAGDNFFLEARRLMEMIERPTLTTVQALAIVAVREASHGRDSRGYIYAGAAVRMALEMGLHLAALDAANSSEESEVRKITFWGLFNLETLYSVFVGRLCQLPLAGVDAQKPIILDQVGSEIWQRYDDTIPSTHQQTAESPLSSLFYDQFISLVELAGEVVTIFYAPREHERVTTRKLAAAYDRYQDWFRQLPNSCRPENTSAPHVLILHMLYYSCILQPYIKLDLSGASLFPHEACTFCANKISKLADVFRATHGLRRVCPPFTSILLSASTIHLLNLPSQESTSHITQGIQDFRMISMHHHFGARCIGIIQSLSERWNITLPEGPAGFAANAREEFPLAAVASNFRPTLPSQGNMFGSNTESLTFSHQDFAYFQQPLGSQQPVLSEGHGNPAIVVDSRYPESATWHPYASRPAIAPHQAIVSSVTAQSAPTEDRTVRWTVEEGSDTISRSQNPITQRPNTFWAEYRRS